MRIMLVPIHVAAGGLAIVLGAVALLVKQADDPSPQRDERDITRMRLAPVAPGGRAASNISAVHSSPNRLTPSIDWNVRRVAVKRRG